jgi:hypothetical protein
MRISHIVLVMFLGLPLFTGCNMNSKLGENLYKSGHVVSVDEVPSTALLTIEVDDDERYMIEGTSIASMDLVIAHLRKNAFGSVQSILLRSNSIRKPEDNSLSKLCEYATTENMNLFGFWPLCGGVLRTDSDGKVSGGEINRDFRLLVRSKE